MGFGIVCLADLAVRIGASGFEIAQCHPGQAARGVHIRQHALDEQRI
jgi:hypothetical protein